MLYFFLLFLFYYSILIWCLNSLGSWVPVSPFLFHWKLVLKLSVAFSYLVSVDTSVFTCIWTRQTYFHTPLLKRTILNKCLLILKQYNTDCELSLQIFVSNLFSFHISLKIFSSSANMFCGFFNTYLLMSYLVNIYENTPLMFWQCPYKSVWIKSSVGTLNRIFH